MQDLVERTDTVVTRACPPDVGKCNGRELARRVRGEGPRSRLPPTSSRRSCAVVSARGLEVDRRAGVGERWRSGRSAEPLVEDAGPPRHGHRGHVERDVRAPRDVPRGQSYRRGRVSGEHRVRSKLQ